MPLRSVENGVLSVTGVIKQMGEPLANLNQKQLELVISSNKLNVAQASALLQGAKVSRQDRIQILKKLGLISATAAQDAATKGLTLSMKQLTGIIWAQVKAWAMTPFGMATIAAAAIFAIVKLVDAFTIAVEESREALAELREEYNENEDELTTLNDELQTTIDRINELQGKDSLTFTEAEELENLRRQNSELERQIALMETIQKQKNRELNKAFVETMNKDLGNKKEYTFSNKYVSSNYTTQFGTDTKKYGKGRSVRTMSERDLLYSAIVRYKELYAELKTASDENKEKIQKDFDDIQKFLTDKAAQLSSDMEGISYISNPTTDDEKAVNEWLDFINDFNDKMMIAMGQSKAKENALNRLIFGGFSNATSELKNLGKQGQVTAKHLEDSRYDAFIQKCIDLGIVADDSEGSLAFLASGFNLLSEAAGSSGDGVDNAKKELNGLSDSITKLQDAYTLLDKAMEEMEDGGLTVDTIKEIAEQVDNLTDYLYIENGAIKLNTQAWREYAKAKVASDIAGIQSSIQKLEEDNKALEAKKKEYEANRAAGSDGGMWNKLIIQQDKAIAANNEEIAKNQELLAIYNTLYADITADLDAYTASLQNFSNVSDAITSISDGLTTVADIQETVAKGFTISLEKALEFAKVYPEILNGATVAADGQIALNEGIVNAFIEGKEAELKAQIDAEVAKLEADKAVLTAKMEFSKAQLELAKSVGTGEGQIAKDVAEYRVNAGNAVAEALIAAGIDEATAYQLACAAMAQNSEEFNRVAKEVCTDVQGNFNQAAYDAAQAIYKNMQNSKISIASVAAQAHQAALAIAGIGSGKVQGSAAVNGSGAGGAYTSKGNISVTSGSFKGTGYTYEAKEISLEDFISDLELDISNYSKAISQIDGQIATLKALRNTSLDKFATSNKSGSDSKNKEDSWFEKEYALHQHLLKMDAENVEDYLDWLNEAYQRAYKEGIIDLNEYYKYQEEVYTGLQDLFKDYLNDVEHEISMRGNYDGEAKKIIQLYEGLIKDVEKEIAAARARGLTDEDDYIQELQKKWKDYTGSIKDLREDITDAAKDALDELIDYRIDMLKKEIEDEKDALDKRLDNLKEFYDKQKELLQDQRDEENYLKDQSDKRKTVTDLQAELAMLEHDDSAWAQKRKIELQEEIKTAQDDLDEFEKDHALDLALDALDKAYNDQEAQLKAEMDALDERLNDPEALFNKALDDIRKNSENQLYYQMLMYNKQFGDGNDETVKELWESAFGALSDYEKLFGKLYNGVKLDNATGVEDEGGWDDEGISGTNPDNQQTTPPPADNTAKEETSAPQLTDDIKKKVAAAIWNGGYGWGTGSTRTQRLAEVFGANNGIQALVNKGVGRTGVSLTNEYTYANMRKKFKGYASGTTSATPGWHEVDELGAEYLFISPSDGTRYRMFTGGEKVLSADATNFLYDFANSGGTVLTKMLADLFKVGGFGNIAKPVQAIDIRQGDVIVQGNADMKTVSEIRRAQRDSLEFMLKELNRLNK